MRKKKIAFIKQGNFSGSNIRTGEQLVARFPEYEVEQIDVLQDLIKPRRLVVLGMLFHIMRFYAGDILRRRRTLRHCMYRTPYIFKKIRELVRARLTPRLDEYAFSFQTQSLFDGSVPGLPHFVYTDHAHLTNLFYPDFRPDQLFARPWIDLEKEVYRNALRVFVMASEVRRSLIEQYGCDPDRVSCVLAGSNVDSSPVPLENAGYSNRTILFVGIDWERKGGPSLVEAFARVRQKLPDARLIIVGCTPPVNQPGVEIVGRIPRDEVKNHIVRATLLCLPSKIEPMGIAPIEAFAQKVPAVATRVGGLPDFISDGENGRLVVPGDVDALAAALMEMLSDPEKCRCFGESGHASVLERYSWNAVGQRLRAGISAAIGI